jgi:hypothetical protein
MVPSQSPLFWLSADSPHVYFDLNCRATFSRRDILTGVRWLVLARVGTDYTYRTLNPSQTPLGLLQNLSSLEIVRPTPAVMQSVIPLQPERQGLSAYGFFHMIEKRLHTLDFLNRERGYVLANASITAADRLAYLSPKRVPTVEETLLFMLESHERTREYFAEFQEADFTDPDMWRIRLNRGVSSQGKLTAFTRKYGLPYVTIRGAVTITQKELIIEKELGVPGLSINFCSVRKRLADLSLSEIDNLCNLIRRSSLLPRFKDNSRMGLRLREDYAFLVRNCT